MKVTYKKFSNIARLWLFANLVDLGETGEKGLSPDVETLFIAYMADVVGNLKTNLFKGEKEADVDLDKIHKHMAKAAAKTEKNIPILTAGGLGPIMMIAATIMQARIADKIIEDLKKEEESNGNS